MKQCIRLIGLPTDINSSYTRGAASAPAAIREALWSDRGNLSCENGMEAGTDFLIEDIGDLALTSDNATDDALIREAVAAALDAGQVPLLLGGDHSVSVPVLEALHARLGPVSILHIDAHPDTYDDFEGNPRSHASPFARIMERQHAARLIQVGIRTLTRHCREQAARFGIMTIEMRNFSIPAVPVLEGPVYISLDLDGLDPAHAPGVSHPEPGGLTVRELLGVLDRVTGQIVGADIVELNPRFDQAGVTAILAAKLVREIASRTIRKGAG
jgi:agmatinase